MSEPNSIVNGSCPESSSSSQATHAITSATLAPDGKDLAKMS